MILHRPPISLSFQLSFLLCNCTATNSLLLLELSSICPFVWLALVIVPKGPSINDVHAERAEGGSEKADKVRKVA